METTERPGAITFKGSPMTLLGPELNTGDTAPEAALTGGDLASVSPLAHGEGKAKLLVMVPSLDTSVCSLETKRFSEEVKNLGDNVAAYTISADLPFAQKRWCGAENVDNLTMLSTHQNAAFGQTWGVQIKELGLLARAVFVVDKSNKITYCEIVREVADEPNYQAALDAVRSVA